MNSPTQHRLAKLSYEAAFTLLEVLLAVVIASGLLATAMYFYHQSTKFRSDLIAETERISSARLLLNRMSSELRGTLHHPARGIGFRGGSNWVEFLKSEIPSQASWSLSIGSTNAATYPETGYRLIRYELAMINIVEDGLNNEANRNMINNLELDDATLNGDATLKQGDAIDRTERRLLSSKPSTNAVATININPVRITDQLKYLQFRYLNNGSWAETWSGPNAPPGVEISVGIDPISATNLLEEYTNHVFRRIVRIPTAAPQVLSNENEETSEEDDEASEDNENEIINL